MAPKWQQSEKAAATGRSLSEGRIMSVQGPEPKYVCSNQDCRLEVFMRKECEIMPPIDDSYHFYGREWMQQDMALQSRMLPRLRRLVHDKLGADKAKEVFEKGLKTTNVQQLRELQREYLGNKNKD